MQHMGKIKIGLFGFGVVGQGIYEVVRKSKNANAEIVKICNSNVFGLIIIKTLYRSG